MSDSLPSFRDRLQSFETSFKPMEPVHILTHDLVTRLGLDLSHLAGLKKKYKNTGVSTQEVVHAIWKDLQEKNEDLLDGISPLSKQELLNRASAALNGIQFVHGRAVSSDMLDKIMWRLLEPWEQKLVVNAEKYQENEADKHKLQKFSFARQEIFLRILHADGKEFSELERSIKEALVADFPKLTAEEEDFLFMEIKEAMGDGPAAKLGDLGIKRAESSYKKIWSNKAVGLIMAAVSETLGQRIADALQPHRHALAERAFNDGDPKALLEALEERNFHACLELVAAEAQNHGLWTADTKLAKYGVERKFEELVRNSTQDLQDKFFNQTPNVPEERIVIFEGEDHKADENGHKIVTDLSSKIKPSNQKYQGLREIYRNRRIKKELKNRISQLNKVDYKQITFGEMSDRLLEIEKLYERSYVAP